MPETRRYTSALRAEQAEATRLKILDGLVAVLADGVESLSIPAVADRAGVSVGTVYRHFGDKAGLLDALLPHAATRTGVAIDEVPTTLDELDDVVRRVFRHFDAVDDLMRAAFASALGRTARLGWTDQRLAGSRALFRSIAPSLTDDQVEHLARMTVLLTLSDTYREMKDRLCLSADEAADEVMWAIRSMLAGAAVS